MSTRVVFGNGPSSDRVKDISTLLGIHGDLDRIGSLQRFEAIVANRQNRNVFVRTMHYPLLLVMDALMSKGTVNVREVSSISGLDVGRLSVSDLISQLELMGFCERVGDEIGMI